MIALVPCVLFLLAGVSGATYLIVDAATTKSYYIKVSEAAESAGPLLVSLQRERQLTLRRLAGASTAQSDLARQRAATDAAAKVAAASFADLEESDLEDPAQQSVDARAALMAQLPVMRARVDGGLVSVIDAYTYYNRIIDQFIVSAQSVAKYSPDSDNSFQQLLVSPLLSGADLMQRADALAAADPASRGLGAADFRAFQADVGAYHQQLEQTVPVAYKAVQDQYAVLKKSQAWQRLTAGEDALLSGKTPNPVSEDRWRTAADEVGKQLMALPSAQSNSANASAEDTLNATGTRTIIAAVLVLLLAAMVSAVALQLSHRLIERLSRLRRESLNLADRKLPELVEKVRSGAEVSIDDTLKPLDHGRDEIGEVAEAFNKAQQTAVSAALHEAKTREGTNKVFLNIAHRSQLIVHRQLEVLDEAQRGQEDPEQLEMLFQLDHLSTRARRNAENLVILGGGEPGRRWRNPVSISELARGAAAETEQYARVAIGTLPHRAVNGRVVGDLVHLLAELIDNAASFSLPEMRVEVRGSMVGRGVVLEIEDRGLGIESRRLNELNAILASPPDFGIMALSVESRLGLFVVARLASRHGISVSLRESAYGGTRAIVLVLAELLSDVPTPGEDDGSASDGSGRPDWSEPELPTAAAELSIPVAGLPPLPIVAPRPGEDLFRPQRPVKEPTNGKHPNGSHESASNGAHGTGAHARPEQPTVPPLPRARGPQNPAPPQREQTAAAWSRAQSREDTQDQALSRPAAFRRDTRRGRQDPAVGETGSHGNNF
jgi:signal transduction histidine kinase